MILNNINVLLESISETKPEFNNGLEMRVQTNKLDLNHILKQIDIKIIAQETVEAYGIEKVVDEIDNIINKSNYKDVVILESCDFFCKSLENIGFRLNFKGFRFEMEAQEMDSNFLQNIPLKEILTATFNVNNFETINKFKECVQDLNNYEKFSKINSSMNESIDKTTEYIKKF